VLSILSRWLIQFCLYLALTSCVPEIFSSFLMTSLRILSSLVYPLTLLRKRISASPRRAISRFVVTHGRQTANISVFLLKVTFVTSPACVTFTNTGWVMDKW